MKKAKKNNFLPGILLFILGIIVLAAGIFIGSRYNRIYFTLLSIPATILLVAGGAGIWHASQRRIAGPSGTGQWLPVGNGYVEAQILGVTRNLRMEGEKESYRIVCRYRDMATGKEATFTSKSLLEYPGKEVIGRTVRVYLDERDPQNYRVDIDPILDEIKKEKREQSR